MLSIYTSTIIYQRKLLFNSQWCINIEKGQLQKGSDYKTLHSKQSSPQSLIEETVNNIVKDEKKVYNQWMILKKYKQTKKETFLRDSIQFV